MVERRHPTYYQSQIRGVSIAKEEAYEELYFKLDTREGANIIYKLDKRKDRRSRDISDIAYRTNMEQS